MISVRDLERYVWGVRVERLPTGSTVAALRSAALSDIPWRGRTSPEVLSVLLRRFDAPQRLMDPFVGGGGVLLAGIAHGFDVVGFDGSVPALINGFLGSGSPKLATEDA